MVAACLFAAAAKIDPSYLPVGANMHPLHLMHCSLGPHEPASNNISIGSATLSS